MPLRPISKFKDFYPLILKLLSKNPQKIIMSVGFSTLYKKYGNPGEMGFVEKIKKVMLNPSEFFEKIKAEKGIEKAFKFLAVVLLVNLVVKILSFVFSIPTISPPGSLKNLLPFAGIPIALLGILLPLLGYFGALLFFFLGVGIVHVFAKLLGGKGDYAATYKALVYASTPTLLFGWIPWVGIIFGLYSLYISLKGISKLHSVSMARAFVIIFLIPALILFVISVILAAITYMFIASLFVGIPGV